MVSVFSLELRERISFADSAVSSESSRHVGTISPDRRPVRDGSGPDPHREKRPRATRDRSGLRSEPVRNEAEPVGRRATAGPDPFGPRMGSTGTTDSMPVFARGPRLNPSSSSRPRGRRPWVLLMKKASLDEAEAFRRLQKLASEQNRKLVEIAGDAADGGRGVPAARAGPSPGWSSLSLGEGPSFGIPSATG
jgi:hypothetical protein